MYEAVKADLKELDYSLLSFIVILISQLVYGLEEVCAAVS